MKKISSIEVKSILKELKKSNVLAEENNLLLKDLLRHRNQISKPASPSLIPAPAAASTIEELDELLASTNIVSVTIFSLIYRLVSLR